MEVTQTPCMCILSIMDYGEMDYGEMYTANAWHVSG